jgi:intracellular sulfur oxidation DsrE/DsrF family protein
MYSQEKASTGPYVKNFGNSFTIENPDLILEPNKIHKVIFDVYSDESKRNAQNPLLVTVARHLNMHGKQGVPLENLKTVLIIHGGATASVLSEQAFESTFDWKNPDFALINELTEAGVEVYVCGQSIKAKGKTKKDLNPNVKMAVSAITTLLSYQDKGYSVINFN